MRLHHEKTVVDEASNASWGILPLAGNWGCIKRYLEMAAKYQSFMMLFLVTRRDAGLADQHGLMSVCEKSLPTNSNGSSSNLASA